MKIIRSAFMTMIALAAGGAAADEVMNYSIIATPQPGYVRYSPAGSPVVTNDWMNGAYVFSAGVLVGEAESADNPETMSYAKCTLLASETGYSWNRSAPEYYLSDTITPPENVDWQGTCELYDTAVKIAAARGVSYPFLLNTDDSNPCLYAVAGGSPTFVWRLKDGSTVTNTYTVSSTCSGRPRRIYWTDAPYNAPPISLQGKFVKMFDNGSVTKIDTGVVTNIVGGVETVQENKIINGVYIDETAQVMYATGDRQGQFVLVYYDTGEYKNILCVEVIEVSKPEATKAYGTIGEKLSPTGQGYDIEGLEAYVTAGIGDSDDNRGDYLYQHAGQYSYSPKNGEVYPLRPSVGRRWKAEIYWLETDPMGVKWPFELDQYESDWPEHGHFYVRGADASDPGAKIYFPDDYTAELCGYQAPSGHAVAVDENNAFYTTGEGWSLIKLTGEDNVWFLPVHSILNTDTTYFTRAVNRVIIGQEFLIRGGKNSGVTAGLRELLTATDDAPGYIYRPTSGTQYNADLYYETTNATADANKQISTDVVSDAANGAKAPSAIFGVNTSEKDIEVWWSRRLQLDVMPAWIDIPTLVQLYRPEWPDEPEAPTIVLASQLGSEGKSRFQYHGAATFDRVNAQLDLSTRRYFPDGTGTLSFWTRPSAYADPIDGATNGPSSLLLLGKTDGGALAFKIGKTENLELYLKDDCIASVPMPTLSRPDVWTHVALSIAGANQYSLYLNFELVAQGKLTNAEFLAETLDYCYAGKMISLEKTAEALVKKIKEQAEESAEAEEASGNFVDCATWAEIGSQLASGKSVRLTQDIDQQIEGSGADDAATIVLDGALDVTIYLNGFSLRAGYSGSRLFKLDNGAELSIRGVGALSGAGFTYAGEGQAVYLAGGSKLTLYPGTVLAGFASDCGGAVYATGSSAVEMQGGIIRNCSAKRDGGACWIGGGSTFTMERGTICACQARQGGALWLANGGTMNNGILLRNVASCTDYCNGASGGAVHVAGGEFVMNLGAINGNSTEGAVTQPGAVTVDGETAAFTMNGGLLSGNTCNSEACSVYSVTGSVTIACGIYDIEPTAAEGESRVSIDSECYEDETLGLYFVGDFGLPVGVSVGRQLAEITMRSRTMSAAEIKEAAFTSLDGDEEGVTGYYSFRPDEDLASIYQIGQGADFRRFLDRVSGIECRARNVSLLTPGAPVYASSVIVADSSPSIYYRNDPADIGYNPNEEHAFVRSGSGGYVVWALRNDLNRGDSRPGVLVSYVQDGAAKMKYFHVQVTNEIWRTLAGDCVAANQLPGPKPITLMDSPWLPEDHWDRDPDRAMYPGNVHRDRKGQLWARCAGVIPLYKYYAMQEGFWFPQYDAEHQPEVGTAIPWLSVFADPKFADDPVNAAAESACWTWTAEWPAVANVMKIGQTLYDSADGLPGVYNMKSLAVMYPAPCEVDRYMETVTLTDPTIERKVAFDHKLLTELGLTTDKNGGLTSRKGKYYFNELPPQLSSRIYVDPTNDKLCFFGKYDQKNAGVSVLYINVFTASEREQLRAVVPESLRSGAAWETWSAAVDELGDGRVEPNEATDDQGELITAYAPRDSYALTARGGYGWVTLIENDAPTTNFTAVVDGVAKTVNMGVNAGDAINMHVFFVTNQYYTARVVTKEDEQNLLSQRLAVMYVDSFGGDSDDYVFEWRSASPGDDGTVPENYNDEQVYQKRGANFADYQSPRITIGEQGDTLANMVNKYWICRYRAKDENCPAWKRMGYNWSDWCAPAALAEGWVQRVLNNVTPFNQLMTDLYENKAETAVSMIAKAGKPYTGDVAFNQDALTECGLIELYETLLNKAESMSLRLRIDDTGANKQLLQAVERLGDLYTVLGDEAYSDAKNPTIGFGSTMTFSDTSLTQVDYGAASSGLFCFDNQVSSLLDEELALLRGRSAESAPYVTMNGRRVTNIAPYYNRLLWNFTKGITAGEVAYAVNYNIEGTETTALSEEQAAAIYPQGHGDAYGHYLSALKGWYRLLRNPYFSWPRSQTEMNVADSAVNVDYYEEAKFSEAALKVAKTAADVVDLTARKAWGDVGGEMSGYRDTMNERSFGYGEWANRGAYGALVNWAVANSLLPVSADEDETFDALFEDQALKRIDRGTVDELVEICSQAAAIQSAEDRIDSGLNPLGLSANAIPFDITPIGVNDGTKTHYEQIRERAGTAVANARKLLDAAQEHSNRLRMIQESTDAYKDAIAAEELAYEQELIGYYGKPYSDDIGPGATYEQGYEGPDLLHYMWMDLSKYGIEEVEDTTAITSYYFDDVVQWTWKYAIYALNGQIEEDYNNLKSSHTAIFRQSASGLIVKPDSITGTRPMQGSIQDKYGEFLAAYAHSKNCLNEYEIAVKNYEYEAEWTQLSAVIDLGVAAALEIVGVVKIALETSARKVKRTIVGLEYQKDLIANTIDDATGAAPGVVGAGTTVVTDPKSVVNAAASLGSSGAELTYNLLLAQKREQDIGGFVGAFFQNVESMIYAGVDYYNQIKALLKTLEDRATIVNTKYMALQDANNAVVNAIEAYNSEVAKAELVLEKREAARKRQVNVIAQARYNDMFFRQLRNQALSRYSAAFDLAQKYVWETAKAYDYETAQLSSDEEAGGSFLDQIIKSRALGSFSADGEPLVGDVGDTGLAGVLAQMDANWLVLKPRLGINNPQPYATWFSLRGECFRILPGAEGDSAWAKELTKYWVDDIGANDDFRRHCQPFVSQFGLKEHEPGLIIPFETTIDFAKNFFGQDLAGGDHAYDSTWYATRIYAAGVWFDGYNAKTEKAGASTRVQLSNTPVVYLVPMGLDCMRVPGLDDGEAIGFNVVDQVIAAPYVIGSSYLNDLSWYPSASDGDLGGADATTKIRKHPSFRAYFDANGGEPTDDKLDCTRLVGRSVWNTKWMLVIPAGSMNRDRDSALSVFINGQDQNRDGTLDLSPVRDIRIGFRTYSNSGN